MTNSEYIIQKYKREVQRQQQALLSGKEDAQEIVPATIRTVGGDVYARWDPNVIWVSMFGDPNDATAVWNGGVVTGAAEELAGTGVLLKRGPKAPYPWRVWDVNPTVTVQGGQATITSNASIAHHGENHQIPAESNKGPDPVYIYQPADRRLKTEGDGSSLVVTVHPLIYQHGSMRRQFLGQQVDLSAHVPGAGLKRRVLLYLDKTTNTIAVAEGATVPHPNATPAPYPTIPSAATAIASAYVELTNGQTAITTATHVEDTRDFLGGGGSSVGELDDLTDVVLTSPVDDELLAYDSASGTWINQTAAEAGLSEDGHTHTEADITDLDHTDADAIHDNVAGEIAAVAEKASPVSTDLVLIEDSEDSNNKKRVQVGNLPGSISGRAMAWMGAAGMLQMLPGLVGLWLGGGIRGSDLDGVADVSGNGLHLARNGGACVGGSSVSELAPAMFFNGVNAYFSHADAAAFDISGTETVVQAFPSYRGLTLGGWFYFDLATIDTNEFLIGKARQAASASSSYHLFRRATDEKIVFFVSDGTITGVASEAVTSVGWRFLVGRYTPGSELKVWVNSSTGINTTSIPSSLQNTSQPFTIGADALSGSFFDGLASLCFLCAAAVPDVMIETFYQYSKVLFSS